MILARASASGDVGAVGPEEVREAVTVLAALGIDAGAYDVAVVGPGLPEDPVAYQRAGATWWLATDWLDQLDELIDRGTPTRASPGGHREPAPAAQTSV